MSIQNALFGAPRHSVCPCTTEGWRDRERERDRHRERNIEAEWERAGKSLERVLLVGEDGVVALGRQPVRVLRDLIQGLNFRMSSEYGI